MKEGIIKEKIIRVFLELKDISFEIERGLFYILE